MAIDKVTTPKFQMDWLMMMACWVHGVGMALEQWQNVGIDVATIPKLQNSLTVNGSKLSR